MGTYHSEQLGWTYLVGSNGVPGSYHWYTEGGCFGEPGSLTFPDYYCHEWGDVQFNDGNIEATWAGIDRDGEAYDGAAIGEVTTWDDLDQPSQIAWNNGVSFDRIIPLDGRWSGKNSDGANVAEYVFEPEPRDPTLYYWEAFQPPERDGYPLDEYGTVRLTGADKVKANWVGPNGEGKATGKLVGFDAYGRPEMIRWNNGVIFNLMEAPNRSPGGDGPILVD